MMLSFVVFEVIRLGIKSKISPASQLAAVVEASIWHTLPFSIDWASVLSALAPDAKNKEYETARVANAKMFLNFIFHLTPDEVVL